jgi:hypothetical protein
MKEETKAEPSAAPDQRDTDLVFLLQAVQQQLIQLEKKVDLLIRRSQEKSGEKPHHAGSFDRKAFSKPFRSHDHAHHRDKGEHEHGHRNRDAGPGHFYERRPQGQSRRSNPGKKRFAFKRKDRE